MELKRTDSEIDEQMNLADDALDNGSKFPGMSYEEGVSNALRWATGQDEHPPMED